mmetsp:Transcript_22716/g.57312  ORF Transcript_22716/g.57312 Transcript_22716/m.57312 type:complete len:234 (+) Transcript_22716:1481-2182(+)
MDQQVRHQSDRVHFSERLELVVQTLGVLRVCEDFIPVGVPGRGAGREAGEGVREVAVDLALDGQPVPAAMGKMSQHLSVGFQRKLQERLIPIDALEALHLQAHAQHGVDHLTPHNVLVSALLDRTAVGEVLEARLHRVLPQEDLGGLPPGMPDELVRVDGLLAAAAALAPREDHDEGGVVVVERHVVVDDIYPASTHRVLLVLLAVVVVKCVVLLAAVVVLALASYGAGDAGR